MSKYESPFILARFLRSDWLRDGAQRIHWVAFMPESKLRPPQIKMEISCYEIQGLSRAEVFEIGATIKLNKLPSVGFASIHEAEFPFIDFSEIMLDHNDIPPRHVNIIGWEKINKRELAFRLADIASRSIVLNN